MDAPDSLRVGEVHGYDTMISVSEEEVNPSMFSVFGRVCSHLHAQGFTVSACAETQKRYPSLSRTTRIGRKGDLEYELRLSGRVLELTFFQNLNIENQAGGKYDFHKLSRMSRAMRLQCLAAMTSLARLYLSLGYALGRRAFPPQVKLPLPLAVRNFAESRPLENLLDQFNQRWNFDSDWERGGRFKRDETGWPVVSEYGGQGNADRDGKPIRNFDVKYYRDYDGYLMRAQVFTNMGNMWCCDSGAGRHYVSERELFDCARPDLLPRRHRPNQLERLRKETESALKTENYARVAVLGGVMRRLRDVQTQASHGV